jgi:hypothetical protein
MGTRGWHPGTLDPLPPTMSTLEADPLLPNVFAAATVPRKLLGTDAG